MYDCHALVSSDSKWIVWACSFFNLSRKKIEAFICSVLLYRIWRCMSAPERERDQHIGNAVQLRKNQGPTTTGFYCEAKYFGEREIHHRERTGICQVSLITLDCFILKRRSLAFCVINKHRTVLVSRQIKQNACLDLFHRNSELLLFWAATNLKWQTTKSYCEK